MKKYFFIVSVLFIAIVSCRTIKINVPPPPPLPPVKPDPVTFPTTINASITGTLNVNGSVSGNGYNQTQSSKIDELFTLTDARTGDEAEKSCGVQWTQSQARSLSQIVPRNVPQGRIYGFSVNTSTQARGGFWRGKVGIFCKGSNDTRGEANSSSVGFINLNYTAPSTIKDQLIIRINGDQNALVEVKEVGGSTLPIQNTNSGKIVELPKSGAYTISSSVSANSSGSGGCPGCASTSSKSVEVLVQSLRDALNPVGSDDLYQVPLPVFIPIGEIQAHLYKELFAANNGRFYPCPEKSDCGKFARGIYLENPQLSVNGAFITIKVHLTGHASFFLFRPGITGDIYLTGTPVVENDVLLIKDISLEVQSSNLILKYVTAKFGEKLVAGIQEKASFPLKPKIEEVTEQLKKQFPIKWGTACLLLDIDKIKLKQVYLKTSPLEGIIADFGISIKIEDESFCK